MKKGAKQIGLKAFGKGKQASDEQLAKINTFALEPLTADQVYVRRFLVAHNGKDRDRERFHEDLLDDFAATLPGKGLFFQGHPGGWTGDGSPGWGLWFDSGTEQITPQEFNKLTGEELVLPDGVQSGKILWAEAYLRTDLSFMEDWTKMIDAGIVRFVSIGFNAPRKSITDDNGNYLYGEYHAKGEALEASFVWLGAQPGASAKSHKGNQPEKPNPHEEERMKALQLLQKALGLKNALTEENLVDEIQEVIKAKDATIAAKEGEIDGLKAFAEDGKAYRKSLVDDTIRFGTLLDEVPSDKDGQKSESDFLTTLPIARLKTMRDKFEKRAREAFPTDPAFTGKDESDRQKANQQAQQKDAAAKGGKKDYTDPAVNELFGTIGK